MVLEAVFAEPAGQIGAEPPVLTVVVPCFNERPNVAPLAHRLAAALDGIAWEVVFVDDDSPDGTTEEARRLASGDSRIRCIRRVGRRGLSSAVIEGALSSSAHFIAVMDGDLQHDETKLRLMLDALDSGVDLVVGSRFAEGADSAGLASAWRLRLSEAGIRLAQRVSALPLSDPMSGFFMLPRPLFEEIAPRLTGKGFKILLDIALSAPRRLRVAEIPFRFTPRVAGESKLDILVIAQFGALLLDKLFGGLLPLRFLSFAGVGTLGVFVHLAVLASLRGLVPISFEAAQALATVVAMIFNFQLNNLVTYRDQRLRDARYWRGLLVFMVVCGVGAVANIGIAQVLYRGHAGWNAAGAVGAAIGVVWNYTVSATLVWRAR
ncbi:MAG: glycosyltransferase family 2 protein [Acetobacteraceae bacterium]|nr:glycosyltransferase family 2 protein [Acetobacteraceae bacterium]